MIVPDPKARRRLEAGKHELPGDLEPAIEIESGDDGLKGIREQRALLAPAALFLALAKAQPASKLELASNPA